MASIAALAAIAFALLGCAATIPFGGIATIAAAMLASNLAVLAIAVWRGRSALNAPDRRAHGDLPPGVVWC